MHSVKVIDAEMWTALGERLRAANLDSFLLFADRLARLVEAEESILSVYRDEAADLAKRLRPRNDAS